DGASQLTIAATADEHCSVGGFLLSVPGQHVSYLWLPNGETTPSIEVCPSDPTMYSVVATDAGGCEERGALTLQPYRINTIDRLSPQSPERKRPHPIAVSPRQEP